MYGRLPWFSIAFSFHARVLTYPFKWQLNSYLFHIWCVDQQKQHIHHAAPDNVVTFIVILAPHTKLPTYLLTYLWFVVSLFLRRMHALWDFIPCAIKYATEALSFSVVHPSVQLAVRCLLYTSHDIYVMYFVNGFQRNLVQIFIMWLGSFRVRGQGQRSRSYVYIVQCIPPPLMLWRRRHTFWECDVAVHLFDIGNVCDSMFIS